MSACSDFDNGFDARQEKYLNEFEAAFGTMDPNHDWSMAQKNKANINLKGIKGNAVVNIFDENPTLTSSAKILATSSVVNGKGSFDFYSVKGRKNVYVQVLQGNNTQFFKRVSVEDGNMFVGELATRAFSDPDACPTEVDGDLVSSYLYFLPSANGGTAENGTAVITFNNTTKTLAEWQKDVEELGGNYQYNNGGFPFEPTSIMKYKNPEATWEGIIIDWSNWEVKNDATVSYGVNGWDQSGQIKFQYFKKTTVETEEAEPWVRGLGQSLFGKKGFFCEQNYYWAPKTTDFDKTTLYGTDDDTKLKTMQQIEAGFAITAKGGPIRIPFVYGATGNNDQFGYILYNEGEDPLTKPHYVLMDDATPESNIRYVGEYSGTVYYPETEGKFSGTSGAYKFIGDWEKLVMEDKDNPEIVDLYQKSYNTPVYGTVYSLVCFDEEGKASYNIPAGTKVVFFLMKVNELDHTAGVNNGALYYSLPELNERLATRNNNQDVPFQLYGYDNKTVNGGTLTYQNGVAPVGAVKATSWYDGTHHYLGFEDGGADEDLNDVVFWVDGAFETQNPPVSFSNIKWHTNINPDVQTDEDLFAMDHKKVGIEYVQPSLIPINGDKEFLGWATSPKGTPIEGSTVPEFIHAITPATDVNYYAIWSGTEETTPASWIFACEDLGGSYDYDFNDIVWEISQPTTTADDGSVTYEAVQVKLLASGGILPVRIIYNGTSITGENDINTKFEGNTKNSEGKYTQINVKAGEALRPGVLLGTLPGTEGSAMDIDDIKSKIQIFVKDSNKEAIFITAPKKGDSEKAPQILVLPGTWQWPTEGTSIDAAYPNFTEWVNDSKNANWTDAVSGKVVTR